MTVLMIVAVRNTSCWRSFNCCGTVLRSRVAHEILDTERKYCSSLWTLIHHFALSLRQSDIISAQDVEYVCVFVFELLINLFLCTLVHWHCWKGLPDVWSSNHLDPDPAKAHTNSNLTVTQVPIENSQQYDYHKLELLARVPPSELINNVHWSL